MTIVMHAMRARAREALLILCPILIVRCSTEEVLVGPELPDPPAAALDVEIDVAGALPDADGYAVIVTIQGEGDRPGEQAAASGGTIRFPALPPGTHAVRLESLAENCRVTNGSNPRLVTLVAGVTRRLEFAVFCRGPGTLLVHTVTRGMDTDSDGYTVAFEGESTRWERIGANDTLRIGEQELPPGGQWNVRLTGIDENCLTASPNPALVTPFLRDTPSQLVFSVVCLQRASRIAFAWDADIFLAPVGGVVVNLTNHPAWDSGPSLSPDRRRIVFASGRDRDEGDLYLLDIDLGTLRRLTAGPGFSFVGSQAWSPDGSKIVFSSTRADSLHDVFILSLDTGEIVQLTDDPQSSDIDPAWSPDGFSIVFSRIRLESDGTFHVGIYRMSAVDGSGIVELAEDGFGPTWSPDGNRIAFTAHVSDEFALNEVAVVDAGGAGPAAMVATGWSPTWSPDGGSIAFTVFRGTVVVGVLDGALLTESLTMFQGLSPSWR